MNQRFLSYTQKGVWAPKYTKLNTLKTVSLKRNRTKLKSGYEKFSWHSGENLGKLWAEQFFFYPLLSEGEERSDESATSPSDWKGCRVQGKFSYWARRALRYNLESFGRLKTINLYNIK